MIPYCIYFLPSAIRIALVLALTQLMHHVDCRGHMVYGGRRQDSMAQIEDMPRTSAGPAQNIFHASFDFMQRRKQR